jgi:aspartate-semialdehyde dehydrogenase
MKKYRFAIVGATGMVGRAFIQVLEEQNLPISEIFFFSSSRSAGSSVLFTGRDYIVEELTETSFDRGIDIALFSAGGSISEKFAPIAVQKGCIVIDNSSFWRMDPAVPLVVPEVNSEDIFWHKGIIANPNCSTIQAVVALNPLHQKFQIERIVYTTFQAVSGAGMAGMDDLKEGILGNPPKKFPHPIAGNVLPHIDSFLPDGYTKEEAKMIHETKKILGDPSMNVTATAVRVPVFNGHSESINVQLKNPFTLDEIKNLFLQSPGIILEDDPSQNLYPLPIYATGRDETFVGRLRKDESIPNGLNLWVVADNIRKGAATNAVQIARVLIHRNSENRKDDL